MDFLFIERRLKRRFNYERMAEDDYEPQRHKGHRGRLVSKKTVSRISIYFRFAKKKILFIFSVPQCLCGLPFFAFFTLQRGAFLLD